MYFNNKLIIGKNKDKEVCLLPNMANRHGLITGASGTGKTITSKVMAESFSDLGVPVFMADVKGDLAGTACVGEMNDNISKRVENLKLDGFEVKEFPVRFWDVYRENGHPIRFRVSDVGPNILSIMLGLSEAQEGVLNILFKVANEVNEEKEKEKWPLDTLSDLKDALNYIGEHHSEYTTNYGNVTTQSVGVILRSLNALENQGLDKFFGKPELNLHDFVSVDNNGRGVINILDAVELYKNPDLYSSVMLCLLTKLYNSMPEVGDLDKPKIVFFFDEAYFLFRDMPSYRLKQVEKIVRLIRSKGIGLYFISHYSVDIPDTILEQLGNRVQHNLRAYTPADQRNVKAAADSFRKNPNFKTYDTILELGTGEAVISFLNEKGEPEVCERAYILPPQSMIGEIKDEVRKEIIKSDVLSKDYNKRIDDNSSFEKLEKINKKVDKKEGKNSKTSKSKKKPWYQKLGKRLYNIFTYRMLSRIVNKILRMIKLK